MKEITVNFSEILLNFHTISYLFQVNEIENMRNDRDPLQQKAKRLGAKNMELVQTNRRQEDRIINQQDEILSLVIIFCSLFFCLRNLY